MSHTQITEVFASFPDKAAGSPSYTIQHPIEDNVLVRENLAVATPAGWRFKAGQVYEACSKEWLAISSSSSKVATQLRSGWNPTQHCSLAPTWFASNDLTEQEQSAWDREVLVLWAMGAIVQVDWQWISQWGPPIVILPIFMVNETEKYRPILDARYSNVSLCSEWFSCPSVLDFCALLSKDLTWFKCDQKSGWQHIACHPLHSRFFCFQWKQKVFSYVTPAFGDATAPYIFTYMGATFKRALNAFNIQHVLYIDDLLVPASTSLQLSQDIRTKVLKKALQLGVVFSTPKCPPPSCRGDALGFHINTSTGTIAFPRNVLPRQIMCSWSYWT